MGSLNTKKNWLLDDFKYKALKSLYLKCSLLWSRRIDKHGSMQRSNISSTDRILYPKNEMNQLMPDELFDPFQLTPTAASALELSHKSQLSVICEILLSHIWDNLKGKHLGGDPVCQIVLCNLTKCFNLITKYRSCLTKWKDKTQAKGGVGEGVTSKKRLTRTVQNLTEWKRSAWNWQGLSDGFIEHT